MCAAERAHLSSFAMGAFMDILEKAKQNIEVISLSFKWVLPLLFILMVAVYVVKLIGYVWFEIDLRIVFENYPLLTVGMPLAALLAFVTSLADSEELPRPI